MKRKRKTYSGAFKAKVGLEAVMGVKTVAQLARDYEVHPMLVSQWKGTIRDRLHELFERPSSPLDVDSERRIAALHEKIGELTVSLDWLKKKSKQLGISTKEES
jgi:transposase-like protein